MTLDTSPPSCPFCHRLGWCATCNGEGVVFARSGRLGRRRARTCRACEGTGHCPLCKGEGTLPPAPSRPPRPEETGTNVDERPPRTTPARVALVLQLLRGQMEPGEACRYYGVNLRDLARWVYCFIEGGEEALQDSYLDAVAEYESRLRQLQDSAEDLAQGIETFRKTLAIEQRGGSPKREKRAGFPGFVQTLDDLVGEAGNPGRKDAAAGGARDGTPGIVSFPGKRSDGTPE